MPRECISCGRTDKYYAKGLCSICYQKSLRRKRLTAKIANHKGVPILPGEKWNDIVGYEEMYMVSNFGRVKSKTREVICSNGKRRVYFEQLLNLTQDKDGYLSVALCRGGKIKCFRVHRLVAEAFIGPQPEDRPFINHKNGIKNDNRVSNLEWCSASANIQHRIYELGVKPLNNVRPIRCVETGEIFPSIHSAVRATGYASSNFVQVLKKRPAHYTVGGYHWEYV